MRVSRLPGVSAALVAALALAVAACGTPPTKVASPVDRLELAAQPVTDARFAAAVNDLLLSPPNTPERKARVAGVLSRQLTRAAARFDQRRGEAGTTSVRGGLTLTQTGELTAEALGPDAARALTGAAAEYSRRGDEGRARAVYELLHQVLPAAQRADTRGHIDALKAWLRGTTSGSPMQAAGALESAAVARRMLEPTAQARTEATTYATAWIAQSYEVRRVFRERRVQPEREDAMEALRALGSGPTVLAAIHLRDGDAAGALSAIDKADARSIAQPDVLASLERVADRAEPAAWLELLRALRTPPRDAEDAPQDPDLLRTVTFCVAREAYRLDPSVPEVAGIVAEGLIELGMPDAAPAVLTAAVRAHPEPSIVSGAISLTLLALLRAAELEDLSLARHTFTAAMPLLAIADDPKLARQASPNAARARAMMGELEVRDGHLKEAEALFSAAAHHEPTGALLLSLARIDAHETKFASAKSRVEIALTKDDTRRDPALRGEALLFQADLLREHGDREASRAVYRRALEDLARVRGDAEGELRARIERLLSRVLDRFGDTAGAERALDRAFEVGAHDKKQAAATVGQQVARALLLRDLRLAQSGLARGVSAQLEREDLVYYALWTRLLERESKQPAEGLAEKLLAQSDGDPRWLGKIAAFGLGKLPAAALLQAATTPSQRAEAYFYGAMERRLQGDAKGTEEGLRKTLAEGGLDLMEVGLARDLLSADKGVLGGPTPAVGLP